eukprot:GHRQ01009856.1.p1 GENE.GHRQ01009856.1~~GHRQ01009856.1.p1  ORF type:complete len:589 (+),score=166.02 GHRQ01009856.1:822-2588(+)
MGREGGGLHATTGTANIVMVLMSTLLCAHVPHPCPPSCPPNCFARNIINYDRLACHAALNMATAAGHNTSSLRLLASNVGPIQAFNITASSLHLASKGVLGSSVSGAFDQAQIITDVATGSIPFASSTPVNLTVNLGGITTVLADVPQGSVISGTAAGLSKVQYTNGTCDVTSETPLLFPVPSIFGPGGVGFSAGNAQQQGRGKCQLVQLGQLQPVVGPASNPQWTCGLIVDGHLSCRQGDNSTGEVLQWDIQNITTVQAAATTPVVAPPPNIGTLDTPDATSPSPATNTAAANTASAGSSAAGAGPQPAVETIGEDPTNAANAANSNAAGAGTAASGVNAPSPAAPVESPAAAPPSASATGAGRKMLQGLTNVGFGVPSIVQGFPFGTTTVLPQGTLSTGGFTSGPGASSFSSGSVGDTTQTTTSQGGSPPSTTLSTGGVGSNIFNPVVVPSTTPETFAADVAASNAPPSPPTTQTAGPAPVEGTAAATPGGAGAASGLPGAAGPPGASGVAVVSTACSSRQQSLSMLVQPAAELQRAGGNFPVRPGGSSTGNFAVRPSGGDGAASPADAGVAGGEGGAGNAAAAPP